MFIFGLSIRQQAGHPNFTHLGHTLVTLGFRLRWEKWNELLAASNLWNRRYLDYFVGMTGTLYLHSACSFWGLDPWGLDPNGFTKPNSSKVIKSYQNSSKVIKSLKSGIKSGINF